MERGDCREFVNQSRLHPRCDKSSRAGAPSEDLLLLEPDRITGKDGAASHHGSIDTYCTLSTCDSGLVAHRSPRMMTISSLSKARGQRERECRPLSDLALHPDPPAVQFDELA